MLPAEHTNLTPAVELGTENKNRLGLYSAEGYLNRRSQTLLSNPEAILNESEEIKIYFNRQNPTYTNEIIRISNPENPMKPSTRIIVAIPSYGEGSRIKHTLQQYVDQDLDLNFYEIIILDNHPESVADDNTADEVARLKEEHPELSVIFAHKTWSDNELATVGNARKYVSDIALARIINSEVSNPNTILVSNDADAIAIAPNYLRSMLQKFDSSPQVDGLVTDLKLPAHVMAKPNINVAYKILGMLEEGLTQAVEETGQPKDPAAFIGKSSAFRVSMYAAVGGFNPNAAIAEDIELSWMMSDARNWNADRVIQFRDTNLTTDPRRHLDAVANSVPINQMLFDFQQKPELRQMETDQLLDSIPDNLDWELLEDEINDNWYSQSIGRKVSEGKFSDVFKRTMSEVGIRYELVDGSVVLKDISRLCQNLSLELGRNIGVVHSEPRAYTPEMIREIRKFFSDLPKGAIEARNRAA